MKNLKSILMLSIAATLLFGCSNSDYYTTPDLSGECSDLTPTKTTQEILALTTNTLQQFGPTFDNDIIEAYVTSSDEGGNFFKSISMVTTDGTQGFSVPIDAYNLYTKFEPGRKVFIKLKGRHYQINADTKSKEIGSLYLDDVSNPTDDAVGRISGVEYENIIKRGCSNVSEETLVNHLTINQAKNDANLNKLIEFDNVQFTDASLGKTYYDATLNDLGGATNHQITDLTGNKIIVRVSSFATFAGNPVTSLSGKVRGVLTKFDTDYQFMVRTVNDIKLDTPRFDSNPALVGSSVAFLGSFNENFESYPTTSPGNVNFTKYINDAVIGTRYWQNTTFGGNKYIQMTSFTSASSTTLINEDNRALFFVPVDFTAANNFSFQSKAGFANGAVLKVYYILASNYTPGGVVNNSSLVDITSQFTISAGLTSGYPTNFTNSGVYGIPPTLTGNGYFVFEYVGSGLTNLTTTMQIDNLLVN